MPALLAAILEAISIIGTVLGIVQWIQGQLQHVTQERTPYLIDDRTADMRAALLVGPNSLQALNTAIAGAVTSINGHTDAALDGLQVQATIPDQPSWYVAPTEVDPDDIATAVWGYLSYTYQLGNFGNRITVNEALSAISGYEAIRQAWYGVPLPTREMFCWVPIATNQYGPSGWSWGNLTTTGWPAVPDWSLWQDGDTPYSFLSRTQPSYSWSATSPAGTTDPSGTAWKISGTAPHQQAYRSNFTQNDIARLSVTLPPLITSESVTVPPVWPGSDLVTLGTPVALSSQLHLEVACDGVIVAITTPPTRTGLYEVGGAPLDYGQGRIAFETDSGDIEPWQYLGFRAAIYTPKSMAHASGVRFQCLAGAAGTVTPWTVTP